MRHSRVAFRPVSNVPGAFHCRQLEPDKTHFLERGGWPSRLRLIVATREYPYLQWRYALRYLRFS